MANLYVTSTQNKFYTNGFKNSAEAIRRRHPEFMATVNKGDAAQFLMKCLFPEQMPMNYQVANLSIREGTHKDKILLAVRPEMTERLGMRLTKGCSVVAKGFWPRYVSNAIFEVQEFLEVADVAKKPFEQMINVFVRNTEHGNKNNRPENILNAELAESLPLISIATAKNTQDWGEFLNWKRELISEKTRGLRFINKRLAAVANHRYEWQFDVVAQSKAIIEHNRKVLGGKEVIIQAVSDSQDHWEYRMPVDNKPGRRKSFIKLGRILGLSPINSSRVSSAMLQDNNWEQPHFVRLSVSLSEEQEIKLHNLNKDEKEQVLEQLESSINNDGFISISALGDIALVNRHQKALKKLRDQAGAAPFLSAYLFDVDQADKPEKFTQIAQWHNDSLNVFQKEAVLKIIHAPDLSLIQGPPGTGKTTVIAEAIIQLVKQGKKVLLASEAHTAVDNALSRLGQHPQLRIMRLAKNKDKISKEGLGFSGIQSLEHYYESLASNCENKFITPAQTTKEWINQLQQWLNPVEYLLADWESQNDKLQDFKQTDQILEKAMNEQWQAIQDKETLYLKQKNQLEQLTLMQKILAEESIPMNVPMFTISLPVKESTQLVRSILSLSKKGFHFNETQHSWELETDNKATILIILLRDWFAMVAQKGTIKRDIERLKKNGSDWFDPQKDLQLKCLQDEIKHIESQMETNESLYSEWRSKRKYFNELKQSFDNPLDWSVYQCLFADYEQLKKCAAHTPLELAVQLEHKMEYLDNKQHLIKLNCLQLLDALASKTSEILLSPVDHSAYEKARQNYALHQSQSKEILNNVASYSDKAEDIYRKCPIKSNKKVTMTLNTLKLFYSNVIQALELSKEKLSKLNLENGRFRAIVREWITDLRQEGRAENDWDVFLNTFIPSCNVVAISCNENDRTLDENGLSHFDVAIIDEVSKATPLELLLPIMRARSAVLVGDHRQLPPMFQEGIDAETYRDSIKNNETVNKSESVLTEENLHRFKKLVTASLFKEHFEKADERIRARLEVQFRMHPQIMDIVNHFYDHRLTCGLQNPDKERAHHVVIKDKNNRSILSENDHVLWIDTTRSLDGITMHREDYIDQKPARTNRLEAALIARTLCQMDKQLQGKRDKQDIGIVSFYASQCRVIKEEIRKVRPGGRFTNLDVDINTVIRYQGKEKSVVLVSLVRHDGRDPEKQSTGKRRLSSHANVARYEFINVAFSRAKNLLVVFGARSLFESYQVCLPNMDNSGSSTRFVYKDIFQQLDRNACIYPAHQLMKKEDYGHHIQSINGSRLRK